VGYSGYVFYSGEICSGRDIITRAVPTLIILCLFVLGTEQMRRSYSRRLEESLEELEESGKTLTILNKSLVR
jgi:hypothetical protein